MPNSPKKAFKSNKRLWRINKTYGKMVSHRVVCNRHNKSFRRSDVRSRSSIRTRFVQISRRASGLSMDIRRLDFRVRRVLSVARRQTETRVAVYRHRRHRQAFIFFDVCNFLADGRASLYGSPRRCGRFCIRKYIRLLGFQTPERFNLKVRSERKVIGDK